MQRSHLHDRGLRADLPLLGRRRVLALLGGAGAAGVLAACSSGSSGGEATSTTAPAASTTGAAPTAASATAPTTATASTTATAPTTAAAATEVIPQETAGPFPGDGSNGPNVLDQSGVVRSDIRSSFATGDAVAEGVLTTVRFRLVDAAGAPLAGAALYAWHCDALGRYSLYSSGVMGEDYLRGVQVADDDGLLSFTTVFPGCYPGRWPHVHFEVFPSLDAASTSGTRLATSQLALPEDVSAEVYGTGAYPTSTQALSRLSVETDGVFRDGWELQTPTASGSVAGGIVLDAVVAVRA